MAEAGYLTQVVVVLLAAIVAVPLFRRLRLGATLGYLVAGIIIGPFGLGLATEVETINTIAELGVVFLLFTVGLELPFERLRVIGARMFALGLAQVGATAWLIGLTAYHLGVTPTAAAVIGGGLALSSTAIVLQLLSKRGDLTSRFGRSAFAVLLVQDLAVGPLLVLVLALGQSELTVPAALRGEMTLEPQACSEEGRRSVIFKLGLDLDSLMFETVEKNFVNDFSMYLTFVDEEIGRTLSRDFRFFNISYGAKEYGSDEAVDPVIEKTLVVPCRPLVVHASAVDTVSGARIDFEQQLPR